MSGSPEIKAFLWYPNEALEAAQFYVSIFPNSRILSEFRSPIQTTVPAGEVLTCEFELNGCSFVALNGGKAFPFNESISFVVPCDTQQEMDYYWEKLTADGGQESQCGWLKDKFGVSWQITPKDWQHLISTPAGMQAMMQMKKFNIAALEAANRA